MTVHIAKPVSIVPLSKTDKQVSHQQSGLFSAAIRFICVIQIFLKSEGLQPSMVIVHPFIKTFTTKNIVMAYCALMYLCTRILEHSATTIAICTIWIRWICELMLGSKMYKMVKFARHTYVKIWTDGTSNPGFVPIGITGILTHITDDFYIFSWAFIVGVIAILHVPITLADSTLLLWRYPIVHWQARPVCRTNPHYCSLMYLIHLRLRH